jgi:hypothetical protein
MFSVYIKSRLISLSTACDTEEELLESLEKYTKIIRGFVAGTRKENSCSLEINYDH